MEKIDQLIKAGGGNRDLAVLLLEGMGWSNGRIGQHIRGINQRLVRKKMKEVNEVAEKRGWRAFSDYRLWELWCETEIS